MSFGAKVEKAMKLVESGMQVQQACKKVGISDPTYYKYKNSAFPKVKTRAKKKAKRTHKKDQKITVIPVEHTHSPKRVITIIGTPAEVMETLRGLL